jgi:BlaI family transcriptional regulator, penicillinase repressor
VKRFKPTRLEMELLEPLWRLGSASIREVQESMPEERRLEYTTVQTIIYRLERKGAVRRVKKIGNAHIFEPLVSRKSAIATLIEDFLGAFGGLHEPFIAHLVESGRVSSVEILELEKIAKERTRKPRS